MKVDLSRMQMLCRLAALAIACWLSAPALSTAAEVRSKSESELHFTDGAGVTRALTLSELRAACDEEVVEVSDPYHKRKMRYTAMALRCVLDLGFETSGGAEGQRTQGMLLRALDGYTRPVRGEALLEAGAFVAFGESSATRGESAPPQFSRIDRGAVDPGPFYLVWTGASQNDPHVHPWPYQLSRIEVAPFSETFPRTVPTGLEAKDPGWLGYAIFQQACASCHAINGEGGKVGPDLNVPRSIVEYRPIDQIRGYVRDPQATRYTSMPAHPNLSDADLDALIAYLSAMSKRKDDPRSRGGL
jgi:mono/diheme cytochrome c family protein